MVFFERTKSGTIVSRFAKDLEELTTKLPASLEFLLSNLSVLITACIAICIVLPWFLIGCVVMLIVCFSIFRVAQVALRDLRRVEAQSLQPLLSILATIVAGSPIIAAFNRTDMFLKRAVALIDRTSAVMLLLQFSGRWLSWRIDLLVNALIATAGILVLLMRSSMDPAFAGLIMSMIIEIGGILQVATRMFLNTETSFISVERMSVFENKLPDEEEELQGQQIVKLSMLDDKQLENWPSRGAIAFESVALTYEDTSEGVLNQKLALDHVSFEIQPREFVAIVGRSGSGKSSIAAVLTRLYGISSGHIVVDGVELSRIPLENLRKAVSVVPQEPCLFSGTIRSNLDPYNEHTDDELWAALERCAMKTKIHNSAVSYQFQSTDSMVGGSDYFFSSNLGMASRRSNYPTLFQSFTSKQQNPPAALNLPVKSNDVRFSNGERQLICLARALVRNSPILILDEATASVDVETENRIMSTLNIEAHKRTIITIVHRLDPILSPTSKCDRILTMEAGQVIDSCDIATMRQRMADASHFQRMAMAGSSL